MLIQDNLALTRAEPSGHGGTQFLYRMGDYGVAVVSKPRENITEIHWEVDVIKYLDPKTFKYEVCHATKLAAKTLRFYNDTAANEFLRKAIQYFNEINLLENMLPAENPSPKAGDLEKLKP